MRNINAFTELAKPKYYWWLLNKMIQYWWGIQMHLLNWQNLLLMIIKQNDIDEEQKHVYRLGKT